MGVKVIITVISVRLTWKLEEDLTIPAFPVWHLVGPRQSSVGFSGLATTPVPVWKGPKISWNLSKLWNNWQYLAYLTLQLMLYHHRHPQPFHNVVIPLHRETSAYKSEMKIYMNWLFTERVTNNSRFFEFLSFCKFYVQSHFFGKFWTLMRNSKNLELWVTRSVYNP